MYLKNCKMIIQETYKNIRRNSAKLLQFLPTIERQKIKYGFCKFLHGIWEDVDCISTLGGISKIFQRSSTVTERILFAVGFIAASCFFTIITRNIYQICRYNPLKTVIADLNLPIFKIPFPEVMICNRNHLNWQRYSEARNKFLKPQHFSAQHEAVFRETVNAYDILRFTRFYVFKNLSQQYPPQLLQDLDYVNFTQVVELMSWKCDEIFTQCSWRNQSRNCCEIFSPRKSPKGLCLAFNTIESEQGAERFRNDPLYPLRTLGSGPRNGLKVRIHIREGWHSPFSHNTKGILVMLLEPHVWTYQHRAIPTNTHLEISMTALLHIHNDNTRFYSADVRKCVFENELESFFYKSLAHHKYMYENCNSECEQEYLMEFCNCTVDLFYPPGPYRACRLTDLPCLYHHDGKLNFLEQLGESNYVKFFHKGLHCSCFLNCQSLNYFTDYHIANLVESKANSNSTEMDVSVYFLRDFLMLYETKAIYPLQNLIASLGGLVGLCIGCSLVGLTELLYFFLFDIPKQGLKCLRSPKQLKVKRERLRTKQIVVKNKHKHTVKNVVRHDGNI